MTNWVPEPEPAGPEPAREPDGRLAGLPRRHPGAGQGGQLPAPPVSRDTWRGGTPDLDLLVTREIQLEDINEAFAALEREGSQELRVRVRLSG